LEVQIKLKKSVLEAMASKVPVVSTNTGGLPEVNLNGISGFMCQVGDTTEMADRCIDILSDEAVHAKFKKQAFEQAKNFDIGKILPMYEQLYDKVISNF
jgi:glycosyltransferase involved in cell wall biosynthesis